MRQINPAEEAEQMLLFDAELRAWWHTQFSPEGFRQLNEGIEGVMWRSILKLLPEEKLGERFQEFLGRPRTELYAMCRLMLLADLRDLTIDQAANAWIFDASVQYALNLPRDPKYLCPRTLNTYRQWLWDDETAQGFYEEVTAALVKELGVEIGRQRCHQAPAGDYINTSGLKSILRQHLHKATTRQKGTPTYTLTNIQCC